MRDRLTKQEDEELYRGLKLAAEEDHWVRHYLRLADHVLFERRPAPRVVVVEDEWRRRPRQPRIAPKPRAA